MWDAPAAQQDHPLDPVLGLVVRWRVVAERRLISCTIVLPLCPERPVPAQVGIDPATPADHRLGLRFPVVIDRAAVETDPVLETDLELVIVPE